MRQLTTGQRLANIRRRWLRMNQYELAEAIKCSRSIVSRVEQDKTEYKLSQVIALEHLCGGLSINSLLTLPNPTKADWLAQYAELSVKKRAVFDSIAREVIKITK